MSANPKKPNPVDVEVGRRIRLQRKLKEMSQSALADELGITFQQVQKYEKGSNRVGASRMAEIARVLDVPVSHFFEGQGTQPINSADEGGYGTSELAEFLASAEGVSLNRAFSSIASPTVRKRIIGLVKALET